MKTIKQLKEEIENVKFEDFHSMLKAQLKQSEDILKLIDEDMKIAEEMSYNNRDEKWIHIQVVLDRLKQKITGDGK